MVIPDRVADPGLLVGGYRRPLCSRLTLQWLLSCRLRAGLRRRCRTLPRASAPLRAKLLRIGTLRRALTGLNLLPSGLALLCGSGPVFTLADTPRLLVRRLALGCALLARIPRLSRAILQARSSV
ncbi:hypothetical protein DSM21852_18060 [Methylocystis bryophila]|nr:hypothetical protein DSM21852_18060 [Methylocystis bryophila]